MTDKMVAQEAGIEEILHEFADFAGDAVLIGHNVALDLTLINSTRRLENSTLVQMLRSMGAFPWRGGHMLEDLSTLYDEPGRNRYSALSDADLPARLCLRMQVEFDRLGIKSSGEAQSVCKDAAWRIVLPRAHHETAHP